MDRFRRLTVALLLALVAASTVTAQQPGQEQKPPAPQPGQQPGQQQGQQPGQQPAADAQTPPVNAEEEADYKTFFEIPREDPQGAIDAGEAFLKKFPDSRYTGSVYSRLVGAYLLLGDVDKLYVAGEKALEINPENVDVLAVFAYAVPRKVRAQDLDAQAKLEKVERYAKHAMNLLNAMVKPEGLSDEDFNRAKDEKLSMAHSGLAMVSYHRRDFPTMASELEQATQLSAAPDPSDFYLLALAYQQMTRFNDAATAFGKCADAVWDFQNTCRQGKEQALKQAAVQPKP